MNFKGKKKIIDIKKEVLLLLLLGIMVQHLPMCSRL